MNLQKEFSDQYQYYCDQYESFLQNEIEKDFKKSFHPELLKAVKYTLNAGGKRFRPVISLATFLGGKKAKANKDALLIAAAVEFIHTYSLIHDDLPSMDNDDLRRGKPTCHKKFSESTAILAGDALNSAAFYLLSKISNNDALVIKDLLTLLHNGAGGPGMVSGQIDDLQNENNRTMTSKILHRIHNRKTGALIQAAMLMGNRLRPDFKKRAAFVNDYSEKLGLLFQITDDILDIKGEAKSLGKTPGKDVKAGKLTFPAVYGIESSERMAKKLVESLESIAPNLESKRDVFFKTLPATIANRKN